MLNVSGELHFQNLVLRNQSFEKIFKTILLLSTEGKVVLFSCPCMCKSVGKTLELNIEQERK